MLDIYIFIVPYKMEYVLYQRGLIVCNCKDNTCFSWEYFCDDFNKPVGVFMKGVQKNTSEKNEHHLIELKSERIIFPDTAKRETHQCKLELKNRDKKSHNITIVAPQSPFHVRHMKLTLKSRHFVRLPIEFVPKKPGHYQAELVLKPDCGGILTVPLIGLCPANESKC